MKFYLLGIKGSGLCALAMYLSDMGYEVSGIDISEKLFTDAKLLAHDIIFDSFENGPHNLKGSDIAIYSTAHKNNPLVTSLNEALPTYEYHEFLSLLLTHQKVIAVAGTHGKTTLVNMLDLATNHTYNLIEGDGEGRYVGSDYTLLEACEYKEHFLGYKPHISIILPLELDHTDYFKSLEEYIASFKKFIAQSERVYIAKTNSNYGLKGKYFPNSRNSVSGTYLESFKARLKYKIESKTYKALLPFKTKHEIEHSLLCLVVTKELGHQVNDVLHRLEDYEGPSRRMQYEVVEDDLYLDDYAHQPSQIREVYESITKTCKDRRKVLIFKPDRISRLRRFKREFIEVFSLFDEVYLVPYHETSDSVIEEYLDYPKIRLFIDFESSDKPSIFAFLSSKNVTSEIERVRNMRTKKGQ